MIYAQLENFRIEAVVNDKQIHYVIKDRNGETVSPIKFQFAADAIDYAHKNFKDVTDV